MGVAAGRGGVEVGDAPHAAVDVVAVADAHRGEDPRDGARRRDRVGHAGARRARGAEDDAAPRAPVDRRHAQAPVEARARALDLVVQADRACAPCGRARASMAERTSAPPGVASAVATVASGEVAAHPQRAAVRSRPRRPPSASGAAAVADGAGGRRGDLPAARRAATIAPAEVPTKASTPCRSAPAGLDAGQDAGHPRLAEQPAPGEDEDVRYDEAVHPPQPTGHADPVASPPTQEPPLQFCMR